VSKYTIIFKGGKNSDKRQHIDKYIINEICEKYRYKPLDVNYSLSLKLQTLFNILHNDPKYKVLYFLNNKMKGKYILRHKKSTYLKNFITKYAIFFMSIFINNSSFSNEENFIHYKVEKHDTLGNILKNHKLKPIYGKNGSIKKFLKLNPKKNKARGNLIYPGEDIILPISKDIENEKIAIDPAQNEFSTSVNNQKKSENLPQLNSLPEGQVYIVYKVKKDDMISKLLHKFGSSPIYGKKRQLSKTLEANPLKKETKGDLIYPDEYIILPISIQILLNSKEFDKNDIKIIKNKPSIDNNINDKKEEISFEDFKKQNEENQKKIEIPNEEKLKNNEIPNEEKQNKEAQQPFSPNNFLTLKGKLKNNVIQLSWESTKGLKMNTYEVKRTLISGKDYQTIEKNLITKSYKDDSIQVGVKYYYVIETVTSDGNSIRSNEVSITTPPSIPENLTATLEQGNVLLKWQESKSSNQITYEIKRSSNNKSNYSSIIKDLTTTQFLDTSVSPSSKYFYIVIAHDSEKNFTPSNEVSIITQPGDIKLFATLKKGFIQLEWKDKKSKTQITYDLLRSNISGEGYIPIAKNLSTKEYKDKDITKGSIYYYLVTAKNINGDSTNSNEFMIKVPQEELKLQVKLENNLITLHWDKSTGNLPIQYEVKRTLTSGKNYETLANNMKDNYFIDQEAQKGFKYFYVVTAHEGEANSVNSNEASLMMSPSPPQNVTLKLNQNNTVLIEWQKNEGNINITYKIKRSLSSKQDYKTIVENLTDNFYIDEKTIPGNKLYYIVTAVNDEGNETDSDEVSIITAPIAPTNLTATLENNTITLDWDDFESNTEIEYEIKRSQISAGEFESLSKEISSTDYTDKNINPEEKYYYIVIAKTEGGESQSSNEASIQSHEGWHVPSSLKSYFGARYLTLKEYNTQNNTYASLYSAASPSVAVDHIQNWEDNLLTYLGIGDLYLDMMQSPIYIMQNRQFHLLNAHMGIEYSTQFNLYLQNEFSVGQELVYQSQGYNTMQDQVVSIMNEKILAGYTFFQIGTMKAQAEAAYILTAPLSYNSNQLGNGYEGAIKVSQQNSGYAIGTRLFYTNRTINTGNVKSNVVEIGIMGEFSLEFGYQ
jgi:LysM domain